MVTDSDESVYVSGVIKTSKTTQSVSIMHLRFTQDKSWFDEDHERRWYGLEVCDLWSHRTLVVPEAKSYYTLEAAEDYKFKLHKFKLPDPPLLEGVKTKEKTLLKMRKVGFQYPTQPVWQFYDINLQVSFVLCCCPWSKRSGQVDAS
ncbi:hypothetical protein CY34DRAFT_106915 [Suillus luteus UH-Slu-Lm8-n1]|uniref:Uncharacterized protein n=1 Tax=Suillus luteus UH-Slu-Lm8-n1 TaxID=930992 RepID=A0A0D0AX33_9AGAM|nr:hypothetical protein CY34DRAFT_106915 [Suillus luteus UH-Slu-Lm8-n1]